MRVLFIGQTFGASSVALPADGSIEVLEFRMRPGDADVLSTEQLSFLAENLADRIREADVVVLLDSEKTPLTRDTLGFFAGYAVAAGKPVVVVGGFFELGLYHPRIVTSEPERVGSTLKKIAKNLAPTLNPERENTDGIVITNVGGSVVVSDPEAPSTSLGGRHDVGNGSHI